MKQILEQIIDKNTEGNYLLSASDKAKIVSDLLDVIYSKTTNWDDIFQNVSEGSGLYRLPCGNYLPLKTYLKEKYYPPKIK